MKKFPVFLGAAVASLMLGCSTTRYSTPIALAPVGPNPEQTASATADGQLVVYSGLHTRKDEPSNATYFNQTWKQHSSYDIYNQQGHRLRHVGNAVGHYAEAPSPVSLPPGQYVVKAQDKDDNWVQVPVIIESGHVTSVHLDGRWHPGTDVPNSALVFAPSGIPVGWRPDAAKYM